MIPALALIITIYGIARLVNDMLKRAPAGTGTAASHGATILTCVFSGLAIAAMIWVCYEIQSASLTPSLSVSP